MSTPTHRIIRQVLELDLGTAEQAIELQQRAAQVLRNQGMATMEAIFNQMVGPHQQVRLDRLELDLGTLHGPDWPEQFTQQLAQQLEHSLGQALRQQGSTPASPSPSATPEATAFEQLLYFCEQGRLPWWGRKPAPNWLDTLQTTLSLAQWRQLATHLRRNQRALRRLVYTASDNFLETFLQSLVAVPDMARVQALLAPTHWPAAAHTYWREQFWTTVLDHFAAVSQAISPSSGSALMRRLLRERQRLQITYPSPSESSAVGNRENTPTDLPPLPAPWQTWVDSSNLNRGAPPSPSLFREADANPSSRPENPESFPPPPELSSLARADFFNRAVDPTSTLPTPQLPNDLAQPSRDVPPPPSLTSLTSLTSPPPRLPIQPDEAVYIEGAGMVILHPFLPELFRSLDVLSDDRQFPHPQAQAQRCAVALLTYLAWGDRPRPEYDLLLPKLLASWPWAEPLPPYELTHSDRQACDELLAAVLQHWSALRSSSADWLREAFFWRDGKLTPVDQGWQLTIERRAQDVLLGRLPWGFGIIRLPWMTDCLYVNWIS